jgi:hypothetical protein
MKKFGKNISKTIKNYENKMFGYFIIPFLKKHIFIRKYNIIILIIFMDKNKQVQNAQKAGRVAKRSQKQRKNKIYKRVRFFRPRTQTLASKPKY